MYKNISKHNFILAFASLCILFFNNTVLTQTTGKMNEAISKHIAANGHPYLFTENRINELAAGGIEWNSIKNFCNNKLISFIGFGYAGWDLRTAAENYAMGYLVSKQIGNTSDAEKYAKKGLALAKVLCRHFGGYGSAYFEGYQFIGLGDESKTNFSLPMTPMPGTTINVMRAPVTEVAITYSSETAQVLVDGDAVFAPILKISNTPGGNADYTSTDYRMEYRDLESTNTWLLRWETANHPASGAKYYVSVPTAVSPTTSFTIQNNSVVFTNAPSKIEAVFAKFISDNYEQTGNFLGGVNCAQPDGPGYANRTFSTGLAEAYDALYDYAGFTQDLKQEFYSILNERLDWYKNFGYEHDGNIGNYYIESFLQPVLMTAYGTQPENPRASEWKSYTLTLIQSTLDALTNSLPSGFYIQGDYSVQTSIDILHTFTLLQNAGGPNYLRGLSWADNLIPAIIHGTKPDWKTFYDNSDWSSLPADANAFSGTVLEFIRDLPDHPMTPYARQWLQDLGDAPPAGLISDYKTTFAPSYNGIVSGPVFARTDWSTDAVWFSFSAEPYLADHQHRDQGHFTIQRGADYLIQDGGGYGSSESLPWHNTIGFDDGGAISNYPPGQGYWGDSVHINKFEDNGDWVYTQTNFAEAYRAAYGGPEKNSVKKAVRSIVFLRSLALIILHDQTKVADASTKQIFNMNFVNSPTQDGNLFTEDVGSSKLFVEALIVPEGSETSIKQIKSDFPITSINYQETVSGKTGETFLHVFQAAANNVSSMTNIGKIISINGNAQGIEVEDGSVKRVILFAVHDFPFINDTISYSPTTLGLHQDILTDLKPDFNYKITISSLTGSIISSDTLSSSNQGNLEINYINSETVKVSAVPYSFVTSTPSDEQQPKDFMLYQNYPNPFNPSTKIKYSISSVGTSLMKFVQLEVYDILGKKVKTLINENKQPGNYEVRFNAGSLPSGIYFYQLRSNGFVQTRKMMLLK